MSQSGRGAEGADGEALVSPLICFEDTVPATARASARGADVLLSISNDAWFEGTCEAAQHHDWIFGFPCAALALLAAFLPKRRPVQ